MEVSIVIIAAPAMVIRIGLIPPRPSEPSP